MKQPIQRTTTSGSGAFSFARLLDRHVLEEEFINNLCHSLLKDNLQGMSCDCLYLIFLTNNSYRTIPSFFPETKSQSLIAQRYLQYLILSFGSQKSPVTLRENTNVEKEKKAQINRNKLISNYFHVLWLNWVPSRFFSKLTYTVNSMKVRHKPNRHKTVTCQNCGRTMRSDNLPRHKQSALAPSLLLQIKLLD